jgi:hypothetical protein
MLHVHTVTGLLIIGIDNENVKRMKDGKPLVIDLSNYGPTTKVMVMHGRTMDDVRQELEKLLGPLPPASPIGHMPGRPS